MDSISALDTKYSKVVGYEGPVMTAKGLGARFHQSPYQAARQLAGLPQGNLLWKVQEE